MPKAESPKRVLPPGLWSGLLFFAVVTSGAAYIVVSKLDEVHAVFVTLVPVCIMIAYAILLGFARLFRLRDDQSGDNLYYMGFLFTLTSLAVSLYQFRTDQGTADQIVQNFGIAIASTIAGIALRIFFNQMRRDPIEVEQTARLELADAARKVKRELESTVLEFSYFRRATQQSLAEAVEEINTQLKDANGRIVGQLDEFAAKSSKPLEEASKKSGDAIVQLNARIAGALQNAISRITGEVGHLSQTMEEASKKSGDTIVQLNARIAGALENAISRIAGEVGQLSQTTEQMVRSLQGIVSKLNALQTPEQIIEIKLSPMIQGLTRAVNNFEKYAEQQAAAVDENLKRTQEMSTGLADLLNFIRASRFAPAARQGAPLSALYHGLRRASSGLFFGANRNARARAERAANATDMSWPSGPSVGLGERDMRGPNA